MTYIPHTPDDIQAMLAAVGVSRVEDLFSTIPEGLRFKRRLDLPPAESEIEVLRDLSALADRNRAAGSTPSFLGGGVYDHAIPSVVPALAGRSEFVTSYTPYQAEISQGVLQTIYEFQTMICELTGMEAANASLYDGGSATAEGAMMALRMAADDRHGIVVLAGVNPLYRRVLATYVEGLPVEIVHPRMESGTADLADLGKRVSQKTACVLVQYPNWLGNLEPLREIISIARERGALVVVSVDPVAMGLLKRPGGLGADIVVGEGQGLGIPMSGGGPALGFLAARMKDIRQMPGRIVGATVDTEGRRGYVLTFQTREQHIRRARATSNICTNQALVALTATIHMAALGKGGLRETAVQCAQKARYAADRLSAISGFSLAFSGVSFFKEFAVRTPVRPAVLNRALAKAGIIGGLDAGTLDKKMKGLWLIAVTEKRTKEEIDRMAEVVSAVVSKRKLTPARAFPVGGPGIEN
ncbi:MAG: glycine dehydrogenase (aminomethyl-transferring) [Nitrospirae bacterium RBG_16_64_22]|nr:MAG: glycine dehydrogenase (aminomethyl-transferring) [Nitrospirae bacterium RBG_16_64_22]